MSHWERVKGDGKTNSVRLTWQAFNLSNGTNAVRYAAVVPPKLGWIKEKSRCDATGEKASLTQFSQLVGSTK